ncbi:hypothetical protein I4U23_015859 [Adineta vaga]|nr:hypothetical protein I4U23_015859 [Adineta vaga]
MSTTVDFLSFFTIFKAQFIRLNLFRSGIEDEIVIQRERRSTRLYLFLFITSLTILVFYYSITRSTQTILIKTPSFEEYSLRSKTISLQCPCQTIAIKYGFFLEIKPIYHGLCQSDLISNEFIHDLYKFYEQTWNNSIPTDFYRIGVFQFQTLRTFCQLTQQTIEYNLEKFFQTEYVQSYLISSKFFQSQISDHFNDFIVLTPKTFLRTLNFIQNITAQNLLMTGASLTSLLPRNQYELLENGESIPYDGMSYTFLDGSNCVCSPSTATNCMGLSTLNQEIVHGFQTGCYMINALLKSTLEVFYNQTFINILMNSTDKYQKLNHSPISNLTIERLLSQMFVIQWSNETFFQRYFNHCMPKLCQYTTNQQHNLLVILITLIGLAGGLSTVLKIISPFIIITIWPMIWTFLSERKTPIAQRDDKNSNTDFSLNNFLKKSILLIKQQFIQFNLFQKLPRSNNEQTLQLERYTTRIYIIILVLTLFILTIFTSSQSETIQMKIKHPSIDTFHGLYKKYSLTLHCSCKQATIDHQLIVSLLPQYHTICASEFLSSEWINMKYLQSSSILTRDYRYQSQFYFQFLSTLCSMAKQTIEESLKLFYQTKFISNQLYPREIFQIQINLILEQFQRTIPETYQRLLILLKANLETNQFITSMNSWFLYDKTDSNGNYILDLTNFIYQSKEKSNCKQESIDFFQGCTCFPLAFDECYRQVIIKENNRIEIIPGMYQTWFPFQSLMMSTFECFYNQTCLSLIKQYIPSNVSLNKFNILTSSSSIENQTFDRIESLANQLFLQSWINQSSYEAYFNHCQPVTCEYFYRRKYQIIYIVTIVIGLVGGIQISLRLFLPYIVLITIRTRNLMFYSEKTNINETKTRRKRLYENVCSLIVNIKQYVVKLNLFISIPLTNDADILHRNRYKTRIYLILLLTAWFILILYASFEQETKIISIESPSVSIYDKLFSKYHVTLHCPCTQSTIKYERFISQFEPIYHGICSSDFISLKWLESIEDPEGLYADMIYGVDFRSIIRLQFQILSHFCTLSKNTLNTSLILFKQTDFLTRNIISRKEFSIRIQTIIDQFKRQTANRFIEIMKLIQLINHGNQFATIFSSNWKFISKYSFDYVDLFLDEPIHLLAKSQTYGNDNCSCGLQSNCSKLSDFPFRSSNISLRQTLPGFRVGCFLLDSMLQSNLICLYNQTCVDMMRASIYYTKPFPVDALNDTLLSMANITIETILSQLFVIKWLENISFDRYFNQCHPHSCEYSYVKQRNLIYIVTTLIGLFGGLTKGLYFSVYYLESLIYTVINHRKKKNKQLDIPVVHQEDIHIEPVTTTTTIQTNMNFVGEQEIFTTTETSLQPIAVTLATKNKIILLYGHNANNSIFSSPIEFSGYSFNNIPTAMTASDINHDGFIDLIVSRQTNISNTKGKLMIFLNRGDGYQFDNANTFSTIAMADIFSIIIADFDRDGKENEMSLSRHNGDIITYSITKIGNSLRAKQISKHFLYEYPSILVKGKFNDDDLDDLATISSQSNTLQVLLAYEKGTFLLILQRLCVEGELDDSIVSSMLDANVWTLTTAFDV